MSDAHLARLAELCGILPEYLDIRGRRHVTAAATQRALLAAMGVDAGSDAVIQAGIIEREERSWRRPLAPVQVVPELAASEQAQERLRDAEFGARLEAARQRDMVDCAAMAALKREILEMLFQQFCEHSAGSDRDRAFRGFCAARGRPLHRHALFEALAEHFRAADAAAWGTPVWPEAYRQPDAPEVAAFAARQQRRVRFYMWLQWLAEEQLAAVGARAAERRLGIGLYLDLPLGSDVGGSEVWSGDGPFATAAALGAPPDAFNAQGQNWGLPPWIPELLMHLGYRPFTELLRANMRHCGAVRIDHVMALLRLFWIPAGERAAQGAYVAYPLDDLLGIVALESQRNQCLVIGEDLGTVPDELRAALDRMGILSSRIFYFEKDREGAYLPPERWPCWRPWSGRACSASSSRPRPIG